MTASRASVNIDSTMSIRAAAFCLCLVVQPQGLVSANVEVLYAPHDAPLDRLVTLYQQAKRYIYVSVYGLTYPRAVQALVAAKKRGVDVRMLTDQERTQEVKRPWRRCVLPGFPSGSTSMRDSCISNRSSSTTKSIRPAR